MSKKTIGFIFLIIILPVVVYLLVPSDASRIKKLFKEGAKAVEREDIDTVMSNVSFNYRDEYGFTYLYIKESMKSVFQQWGDTKIEYENLKIDIKGKNAVADMDVRVTASIGDNTGYVIGDLTKPVHLRFTLEKERTKWLVTKAEGFAFDL
jgi:hypothetical protein